MHELQLPVHEQDRVIRVSGDGGWPVQERQIVPEAQAVSA
jgi:hypothetical protein